MAIDFKNKTDNHNSSKNPFGNTSQTGSSQSTGFSFGGGKQDQKNRLILTKIEERVSVLTGRGIEPGVPATGFPTFPSSDLTIP